MCWIIILPFSMLHSLLMKQLNFSMGTEIPHFFCELAQVLKVASSDTLVNNTLLYIATALFCMFPVTGIISYSQIVSALLKMYSAISKSKAFSTCGSHLCVIYLFYGTALGVYLSSAGTHSSQGSTVSSVMCTVVTPMLSPFICSLRNRDVMGALVRLLRAGSCP